MRSGRSFAATAANPPTSVSGAGFFTNAMSLNNATATLSVAWNGTPPAPANSVLQINTAELAAVGFSIAGTFVATVLLEVSMDGVTWDPPNTFTLAKAAGATSFAAPARNLIQVAGLALLRARMSAYTSGTAVVLFCGSLAGV